MEPIFSEGFILTLDADRFSGAVPSSSHAVILTGAPDHCLTMLQTLKKQAPQTYVGVSVSSLSEALSALQSGAVFLCPETVSEDLSSEWRKISPNVFPVCPKEKENLVKMLDSGFHTFLLVSDSPEEALHTLGVLYKDYPEAEFICAGPYEGDAIAALTPFYSVRSVCSRPVCSENEAAQISLLAQKSVLGFEFAHLGINTNSEREANLLAQSFASLFGFSSWDNGNSVYASESIECMKFQQIGRLGHIAIRSNSVIRAKDYLVTKGFTPIEETAKYKDGRLHNIYFNEDFGGFSIHLLQKRPDMPL